MDDQDPSVVGERLMPRTAATAVTAPGENDDEPRLRQLQAEVAEARVEIATTIGAIEERLRPSALATSAKEAVADKAASISDRIVSSEPARYARANPWATVLVLTGAVVTAWLMVSPRRRPHRRQRPSRRQGTGRDFRVTHYDAGVEHSIEPGMSPAANTSPIPAAGVHSQTYGGTA